MKLIQKIPLAFYILLCYTCFSGYYAFERILNTDNSYYFFKLVNTQHFWFAENRFGIIFSQIPLLLATRMGVSLTLLIYIYSLSFPVLYALIALFCRYYLKVTEAALVIALLLIIGIAFSFFHPVTETYHALVYAVLAYAVLVSDRLQQKKYLYYFSILVASFLSIISHPIGVFAVGFVALFSFVTKKTTITPLIFVVGIAGLATALRLAFVSEVSYDVQQYDALFANFAADTDWSTLYPVVYFIARIDAVYLSTCILFITLIVSALYTKNALVLLVSIVCASGFIIIGILTFAKGDAEMMMEKTFMPAIFMLLLPFCYLFTILNKTPKKIVLAIILIMTVLSFRQIVKASEIATERLAVLELIAKRAEHPKLIAQLDDFNEPSLYFNHWNTVVDSYVIAKCRANKEFTLFVTPDKYTFKFDSTDVYQFLGPPWYPYWNKKFENNTYFKLPRTGYRLYENNEVK